MHLQRSFLAWALFFLLLSLTGAESAGATSSPELARGLRERFFNVSPEQAGLNATGEDNEIFGVLMDWHGERIVLSVLALSDGTASVYASNGNVILGGYAAAVSAKALISRAKESLIYSVEVREHPYPEREMVRFYIRTYSGLRLIEERADLLLARQSKHTLLFMTANQVITDLRVAKEKAESAERVQKK